jgi:ubiquinone/menaquinone biosynthesis C-methylase UbiE
MTQISRHADYDEIAPTFDKRYERNEYAGVARFLPEFIGNQEGLFILEVGCGTGHWLEALRAPGRRLTGLDYSAGMLARAQSRVQNVTLIRGTAEALPLPAHSFDRVFCINALHHFPDKPAFLAEARRILRPGGRLMSVGLDPHRGQDRWHVYDYFPESLTIDRQRYPSSDALREWMAVAGFADCTTQEVEHWSSRIPAREALAQGRLEKAATSQLSVLTDKEYEQGIRRLRDDIERLEENGETLFLTIDLRLYATSGSV